MEDFTTDVGGYASETLEHDGAGNLTYDGLFRYGYDAWNRQVKVSNAYRQSGAIQEGSAISTSQCDGLGFSEEEGWLKMRRSTTIAVVSVVMLLGCLGREASAMLQPAQGRFLQRDPLGYVEGMNVYEYVESQPIDGLDPEGLRNLVDPPRHAPGDPIRRMPPSRPTPPSRPIRLPSPKPKPILPPGLGGIVKKAGPILLGGQIVAIIIDEGSQIAMENDYARLAKPARCIPKNCHDHHIASKYPNLGRVPGVPNLRDAYEDILGEGGIDIDSGHPNVCEVCDVGDGRVHQGPHPVDYHKQVLDRLLAARERAYESLTPDLSSDAIRRAVRRELTKELIKICEELNTAGNSLRDLVAKKK